MMRLKNIYLSFKKGEAHIMNSLNEDSTVELEETESNVVEVQPPIKKTSHIKQILFYAQTLIIIGALGTWGVSELPQHLTRVKQDIQAKFTREVKVEVQVPIPRPPRDPEAIIVGQYMRARNSRLSIEITELIADELVAQAKIAGFPPELLVGIIEKESLFNPMVTTQIPGGKPDATAKGLMQLYQAENIEIDQNRAWDIKYNIATGCKILSKKLELTDANMSKALSNYSGNAKGYTTDVLQSVGRFTLYKWDKGNVVEDIGTAVSKSTNSGQELQPNRSIVSNFR